MTERMNGCSLIARSPAHSTTEWLLPHIIRQSGYHRSSCQMYTTPAHMNYACMFSRIKHNSSITTAMVQVCMLPTHTWYCYTIQYISHAIYDWICNAKMFIMCNHIRYVHCSMQYTPYVYICKYYRGRERDTQHNHYDLGIPYTASIWRDTSHIIYITYLQRVIDTSIYIYIYIK